MSGHVERYILARHPEILQPPGSAAYVLIHADSVNEKSGEPNKIRFLIDAARIRAAGFVTSRTIKRVDLLVESRQVGAEMLLRAYHLTPTRQGARGPQRWP